DRSGAHREGGHLGEDRRAERAHALDERVDGGWCGGHVAIMPLGQPQAAGPVREPHFAQVPSRFAQMGCTKVGLLRSGLERSWVTLSDMCGIVGYAGARPALSIVLDGLRRPEYRGYDSAGVALVGAGAGSGSLLICKRAGELANLEKALAEESAGEDSPLAGIDSGTTGIGHTRWATHGAPTDRNAHPHPSRHGDLAVIHNGIIENFARLRAELEADSVEFRSDTDTECAARLLEPEPAGVRAAIDARGGDGLDAEVRAEALAEAMRRVCRRLEGAFTLLAVDAATPDVVVGARRNSPLVVGRGQGENFLASDVAAFVEHTRDAIELG